MNGNTTHEREYHMTKKSKPMGGARPGAGRTQTTYKISTDAAKHLQVIAKHYGNKPEELLEGIIQQTAAQKLMDDLSKPIPAVQKLMDDLSKPIPAVQKLMDDLSKPTPAVQKLMDDFTGQTAAQTLIDSLSGQTAAQTLIDSLSGQTAAQKLMDDLRGKRPPAGKKPKYRNVELTATAADDLAWFIEDLALDQQEASLIVSTILSAALTHDRDNWANLFGNRLIQAQPE
jgi:hypothetical protein